MEFSKEISISLEWAVNQADVERIANLARLEQDLSPYQTKKIQFFDRQDLLLYDWGIHHLHLGKYLPRKDFSERTGTLLYGVFLEDVAYFIALMDHSAFSEIKLLEILETNWPEYLTYFELKGILGASSNRTGAEIKILREAGIQNIITLRSGRVLGPPGGGITTAGTSQKSMMAAQAHVRLLRNAEKYVKTHEAEIRSQLEISNDVRICLMEMSPAHIIIVGEGKEKALRIPIES